MKTDHELKTDVETELRFEPSVNEAHLGVAVTQGIVTLTGHVPSYVEKCAAERATKRVTGVRAVANEIDVRCTFTTKWSDDDIAAACLGAFRANAVIPHDKLTVVVSSGWVTLDGTLDWHSQRAAAEAAVRNLRGVVGITNLIKLVNQAPVVDTISP